MIDLINPFAFPLGDVAFRRALPAAHATGRLQARARPQKIPMIYVNERFDKRIKHLRDLFTAGIDVGDRARSLVNLLKVDPTRDHFVPKTRHSGFFSTRLDALLQELDVDHLILTGIAADICVLATAFDAHMRDYAIAVPPDCVAAESSDAEKWALGLMSRVFNANTSNSVALSLTPFRGGAARLARPDDRKNLTDISKSGRRIAPRVKLPGDGVFDLD